MGMCSSQDNDEEQRNAAFQEFTKNLTRKMARDKFVELDVNNDGRLAGEELMLLAMWVWEGFHETPPNYKQLSRLKDKILHKRDKDGDRSLTWDEFCEFYNDASKATGEKKLAVKG